MGRATLPSTGLRPRGAVEEEVSPTDLVCRIVGEEPQCCVQEQAGIATVGRAGRAVKTVLHHPNVTGTQGTMDQTYSRVVLVEIVEVSKPSQCRTNC